MRLLVGCLVRCCWRPLAIIPSHVPPLEGLSRISYKVSRTRHLQEEDLLILRRKEEFSVIIIGLDGAGKTVRKNPRPASNACRMTITIA